MIRLIRCFCISAFLLACSVAGAQENVTFATVSTNAEVSGVLTKPATVDGKIPAVVLLHHGGGWEKTQTKQYADALSKAGYVTLEVILFHNRESQNPRPTLYLPHVFGALKYLSGLDYVDPKKIAISGGSYGGLLTILSATEWATSQYGTPHGIKFAAHAAFYPVCWIIADFVTKKPSRLPVPGTMYDKYTGSPIKIYAGSEDDYDARDPKACDSLVQAVPEDQRSIFNVRVFQGTTHGWDHSSSNNFYEKIACKGKGCYNTNSTDAKITADGIEDLTGFLKTAMSK